MNGGQKAVVCVALGAVALVVALTARALWWDSPTGGWFNYAPNNGVIYSPAGPDRGQVLVQAVVWIALVVAWAAACLVVLRDRVRPAGDGP